MLGHVILISAQVNSRAGVPLLEAVTFGVFAEVQRGARAASSAASAASWSGYVGLRGVRARERRAEAAARRRCRSQLQQQRALAERTRSLEQLLELREQARSSRPTAAEVIAGGATPGLPHRDDRQGIGATG